MLQPNRYIIETNIGRFREHLRSGLLDAGQTRTVIALLAEALRGTGRVRPALRDPAPIDCRPDVATAQSMLMATGPFALKARRLA